MLLSQFLIHLIAMLVIVILSIVFVPRGFERSFMLPWVASHSVINYLRFFIPITLTAFVSCFSMSVRYDDLSALKSSSLFTVIRGTLVFLLILVLIYILLVLLLWPWVYQQRFLAESRSEFINSSIEQSVEYLNQQEYSLANEEIERVLSLVPLHEEGIALYREIQTLMPETPVPPRVEEPPPTLPLGLEYNEISALAEQYFNEQNYFSAVFYARLALGPREERDEPAARRILTESLRIIDRLNLSDSEQSERELFYLKRSGSQAYNSGEYINAYYIFKEIQSLNPLDADAETYLADIEPRMEEVSFFIDEIDEANSGEIRKNIFIRIPFLSEREEPETSSNQRFLAAGQMMQGRTGLYFTDLEYMELSPTGFIIRHIAIPYAKLSGTYLIIQVIDRERQGDIFQPNYIRGVKDSSILEISTTENELWAMNPASTHYSDSNIAQLFSLSDLYPLFGRNPIFPQVEILYRLLLPFCLITGSLFVITLAWRNRNRYINGPPGYIRIFFPLIPAFVFGIFELYITVCRNMLTSVLLLSNFTIALVVLAVSQTLLFMIFLFALAGQNTT